MSRLTFNEMDLSGDEGTKPEESGGVARTTKNTSTKVPTQRSYALFDINTEEDHQLVAKSQGKSSSAIVLPAKNYDVSTPEEEPMEAESEKYISREDFSVNPNLKDQSNDIIDKIFEDDAPKPITYDRPLSNFLSKFLAEKRAYTIVEPPLDLELSNDIYLREFCEEFKSEEIVDSEEETDEIFSEKVTKTLSLSVIHTDDMEDIPEADDDDDESFIDGQTGLPKWGTVQTFNLPYEVTVEQLSELIRKQGLKCKRVTLGTLERKRGMPLGSALMDIYFSKKCDTVENIIDILNGRSCGGRNMRVQKLAGENGRKRASFGSKDATRYFERDITCKCTKCGVVGHRASECFTSPLPMPCHLCAGLDHDAADCINMVCYRCCKFGHHSRQCRNGNQPRAQICFQCGSTKHDILQCRYYNDFEAKESSKYASLVAGCWVRCMCCQQTGHTMCGKVLYSNVKDSHSRIADVYCPNCGEKGHHCDYEPSSRKSWLQSEYCMAPKYEAYMKYPQLLKDIKDIHDERNDDYYRKVLRHPNDRALFPSLLRPAEAVEAARRKGRNNKDNANAKNGTGSRNVKYYSDDEEEDYRRRDRDRDHRGDRDREYGRNNNNNNSTRNDREREERQRERSRERVREREGTMKRERDEVNANNTKRNAPSTTVGNNTNWSKLKQSTITTFTTSSSSGNNQPKESNNGGKKRKLGKEEEGYGEEDRAAIRHYEETSTRSVAAQPTKKSKVTPLVTALPEKIVSVTTTAPSAIPTIEPDTKWLEKMENRKKRFANA